MVVAANDNAEDDAKQCVARFFLSRPLQFYYEYIFGCRFIRWDIWEIKTEAQQNAALTCEWNVIEPAHVQCEKWIWEREEKAKNRSKKNTFGSIEGWKQMNNNYGIRTKKEILIHSMEQQQQLPTNGTPAHTCAFLFPFFLLFFPFLCSLLLLLEWNFLSQGTRTSCVAILLRRSAKAIEFLQATKRVFARERRRMRWNSWRIMANNKWMASEMKPL